MLGVGLGHSTGAKLIIIPGKDDERLLLPKTHSLFPEMMISDQTMRCWMMIPPDACTTIEEVRQGIDELDRAIITALGQRFHYVKAVTRFKRNAEEVRATERYQAVLHSRRLWAADAGLNPDVVEEMYRLLIGHFIEEEMKLVHGRSQA